jgi:hypothetical protein
MNQLNGIIGKQMTPPPPQQAQPVAPPAQQLELTGPANGPQ